MARPAPELLAHQEWLGQIQPVGLVVSVTVLVKRGVFVDRQGGAQNQIRLRELSESPFDFLTFAREILEWPERLLAGSFGGSELPDSLTVALPEHNDRLSPTYAVPDPEPAATQSGSAAWLALVSVVPTDVDLDRQPVDHAGWRATPHARLERLLRETGVPIGLLFNGSSLRLVYAPRGESSGHLTFRFPHLVETLGRPMVSALSALLGVERVTDVLPADQRLPALLAESRRYQNEVSTALAGQVLEALWELLRGFQRADDDSKGELLREALREDPREVYGGLLATLLRLVFILYAEDRGLMPQSAVYQRHYSVSGLFERLREDQVRYPDTMDARYGAWAHLLALFRLIHDGGGHGDLRFPARHGRLFNPDSYPFLEGRPLRSARQVGEVLEAPRVPDGTVFRVLQNLLILDGERLSYRALDVEQIGSVYEAMMGFALETAKGPSIALSPKQVIVNLDELLEQKGKDRAGWLREHAELKITSDALANASSAGDLVAALGSRVSRYTPSPLRPGSMYLQPTEERRRSGSHYTPRSLTDPIVRTTLRPILVRLGDQATPGQVLDLKVCDPAMGSGAFLVEACRLLAERLVRAWEVHGATPKVPDDEDVLMYARRLVAERCLYGVDKNVFAVDLAKLSLWLATLARDHPFTFLDHALRHGDSLVGLSREQIACLHWTPGKQLPLNRTFLDARVAEAQRLREQIQGMGSSDDVPEKARLLRDAEETIAEVRLFGDCVVSAFFDSSPSRVGVSSAGPDAVQPTSRAGVSPDLGGSVSPAKRREAIRTAYAGKIEAWLSGESAVGRAFPGLSQVEGKPAVADESSSPSDKRTNGAAIDLLLRSIQCSLREGDHPVPAFHWQIEFPEVFIRANPGFDAFVGNPPFAGKNTLSAAQREGYLPWLLEIHDESHGNADLVAHFYRRAFNMLRPGGAFGLIATNTIAQGDTRGTGLRWIRKHGGMVFAARKRVKWPGASAVVVSVVHVMRGELPRPYDLDGRPVDRITAFLFHAGGDDDPAVLRANAGKSFIGSYVLGMGFTFDDTDKSGVANPLSLMHELIRKDPRNAERIFPYIGGEEVNDSPTHAHHRYVINFGQMPLRRDLLDGTWADADERTRERWLRTGIVPLDYPDPVAADWPDLLAIVEQKVKPDRLAQNREVRARYWWRYGEVAPALYGAIRGLERVLVSSLVSQFLAFAWRPSTFVYSHKLCVAANASQATFAVLQCRVHEAFALFFSSTLEDRLNYSPSDAFETFPFPFDSRRRPDDGARSGQAPVGEGVGVSAARSRQAPEAADISAGGVPRSGQAPAGTRDASVYVLERVGREYYEFRAALMVRNNEGLTKTYNRFHDPDERDPDIVRLRELHDAMDRAVLDAYGWTDIRPRCEFILDYENEEDETPGKASKRRKPWRYRWPDDVRDEVLARLLDLNAQRAQEEALTDTGTAAVRGHRQPRGKSRSVTGVPLLDDPM